MILPAFTTENCGLKFGASTASYLLELVNFIFFYQAMSPDSHSFILFYFNFLLLKKMKLNFGTLELMAVMNQLGWVAFFIICLKFFYDWHAFKWVRA